MKTIYKKLFVLLLLLPFSVLAQTVTGTVTEQATGLPLPGASIVVQGTTNGTASDIDGRFSLSGLKKGDVISISAIGFAAQSITYDSQRTISVVLVEEAAQLQEVIVQVGYGSVRKKDATGAVATVTTEDFNRGVTVTTENLLNGRVSGLSINTSGAPGSGSQIRIRGGGSLNASNDPLIVIDGLPIENSTNTGSTSFLASLNPNTIESVTVLKDASATAIYGSRASNGVIIITTKKGTGQLAFEYNFQYGTGSLTDKVDVFSADRYRALINSRFPTSDVTAPDYAANLAVVSKMGTANTDWQDAIYRNHTDLVDHNFTVRGSLFDRVPTRVTIGRTYQEGLRLTNEWTRNTANIALNPSFFGDHLKVRLNANYVNENSRFADGVEGTAIQFDPTQPVFDADSPFLGYFQYYNPVTGLLLPNVPRNPVAQLVNTNDTGRNNRVFGNVELDYKFHFLPELRATVNLGFDESRGMRRRTVSGDEGSAPENGLDPYGTNEYSTGYQRNKLFDSYLTYNNTFDDFGVELTAGHSYQSIYAEYFIQGNLNNPTLPANFPETERNTPVYLLAFFGRANLSYDDFLLTLSYRRDGTSRFSPDQRWGNFPAAAFAWKMNETFFADSKTLSELKLRLGYGVTGQQNFSAPNSYLQKYFTGSGASQYQFGTNYMAIAIPDRLSPGLKWEEAKTYNVGVDFGLFDNRLSGTLEAYYRETDDLLSDAVVPDGSNFSNRGWQNVGSFTTRGLEFNLNADIFRAAEPGDLDWRINFNATTFQREITSLPYDSPIFVGGNVAGTGTPGQIHAIGYAPFSFFVYKQLYDADNNPIEGAYADTNGDGIVNPSDKYIYKNPDPDLLLGFSSNFTYKNFDLYFNLRASIGNHIYNGVNAGRAQYGTLQNNAALSNVPTSVLDTGFTTVSDVLLSDIYIENASFLRMDNITLGYTFQNVADGKASLRLYTGCQNAFVLTKYSGLDPEIANDGLDQTIYPRQRTFLFGANVKF